MNRRHAAKGLTSLRLYSTQPGMMLLIETRSSPRWWAWRFATFLRLLVVGPLVRHAHQPRTVQRWGLATRPLRVTFHRNTLAARLATRARANSQVTRRCGTCALVDMRQ